MQQIFQTTTLHRNNKKELDVYYALSGHSISSGSCLIMAGAF